MQEQLPCISQFYDVGIHNYVVCNFVAMNPGTGLALIRLCKHARFTITARGRAYNSPHLHQTKTQANISRLLFCLYDGKYVVGS